MFNGYSLLEIFIVLIGYLHPRVEGSGRSTMASVGSGRIAVFHALGLISLQMDHLRSFNSRWCTAEPTNVDQHTAQKLTGFTSTRELRVPEKHASHGYRSPVETGYRERQAIPIVAGTIGIQ